MMISFLFAVLREAWGILEDASVFLLFGFLLAGVLAVLVPGRLLTRLVGAGKIKSVLWGSVLGAPLPLCSCGVLPTALGLRKEGATPGATVAFLVATPETGVDSISLTYALTDPLMTVFRPVAGVATAIAAGLATNLFGAPGSSATGRTLLPAKNPAAGSDSDQCQHAGDAAQGLDHAHGQDHHHDHAREANSQPDSGATSGSAAVDATRRIIWASFCPPSPSSQFQRSYSTACGAAESSRCC
jgi:uncharacterized membrane protein YraQ (UPF0718 family)